MYITIALACLLMVLAGSFEVRQASEVEKRDADMDLEVLLDEMQREEDSESVARRSEQDLSFSEEDMVRNDIFVEKRWRDVYASYDDSRENRVMNSITPQQAAAITNLHNKLRGQEGSSNMETLHYSPKLAALAQTWSQRCVFEHGQPPFSPNDIGYEHLGQNIYAHTQTDFAVEQAVQAWYDEKKDYQYNSISCNAGKICGHYTAVTWAKTTLVGCGLTFCPSISGLTKAHFIVCNYAPAGNFQGEKPFVKGPVCTQCDSGKFYCNNGLCDSTCTSAGANCQCKASCQKCGKQTSDCKCACEPGTMGPDCSKVCADVDPKCGANPGYPTFLCTQNDPNWAFVKDKCPKMCGKCKAGTGKPCKKRGSQKSILKRLMLGYLDDELNEED